MSLESGPLVTMLILGSTGVAVFEPHVFVGAVLPFLIGFLLGNLDHDLRTYFGKATQALIPFFGFALGSSIDLGVIVDTGLLGILLGVVVIIITGVPLILADKFIGRGNGTAGLAASSTAGAAVANPMLVANMKPEFLPAAETATALVAASVIVTSILVPIITAYYSGYMKKKNPPAAEGPVDVQVQEAAV
jgi:2-keto-3-deoxygluconate permease